MNENAKKVLLIAVAVLGAGVAAFFGVQLVTGDQPRVENVVTLPADSRSMKDVEMEQQNRQTTGADIAAGAPIPLQGQGRDGDLGGDLTGKGSGE